MNTLGRTCLFLLLALGTAGAALGQTEPAQQDLGQVDIEVEEIATEKTTRSPNNTPFGIRAGYTHWKDINQAHAGAHVYLGELWPNVEFTPNVEFGFGDSVFIMTLNADITYLFTEFVRYPWGLYGGGSLSFNLVNPELGDNTTDLGLSALIGTKYTFANEHKGMLEVRFGIMDSPAIKATIGYTLF